MLFVNCFLLGVILHLILDRNSEHKKSRSKIAVRLRDHLTSFMSTLQYLVDFISTNVINYESSQDKMHIESIIIHLHDLGLMYKLFRQNNVLCFLQIFFNWGYQIQMDLEIHRCKLLYDDYFSLSYHDALNISFFQFILMLI